MKKGTQIGGKPGRLERFGTKRNGYDGYRAYQGPARAWCYLCQAPHTWAQHAEWMKVRAAIKEEKP